METIAHQIASSYWHVAKLLIRYLKRVYSLNLHDRIYLFILILNKSIKINQPNIDSFSSL